MATHESESETFRNYLASDWHQWLSEYPELATSFGFPGFDDRWTDDSPEGIERRLRHLAESSAALRRIDSSRLSPRERTSYELYRKILDDAQSGLAYGLDPLPFQLGMPHNLRLPINQMEGVHLTASETLEIQPRTRLSEYENIVSRLRLLGAAVDENLALLSAGLRQGFTAHRVAVRGVPDQVRGLVPNDPLASPLLHAFTEFPDRIRTDDRKRLLDEAKEAYSAGVAPAFARLHEFLVSTYLPACRETPGISSLPDGPALYDYLVRWETTTDLTPKQIHEIGLAEVRRIRSAMETQKSSSGFAGTFSEFLEFLRTDPRFFPATAEALVD